VSSSTELAPRLAERIAHADDDEPIEVVIELAGDPPTTNGSRTERIAAARSAFERDLAAVTPTIAAAGGTIDDSVWLNRTVRGTVPAGEVERIAADDRIAAVDLPATIEPEGHSAKSP